MSTLSTYAYLLELWPVLIPGVVELGLVALMIFLKWHYARRILALESEAAAKKLAEESTPIEKSMTDTKLDP